MTPDEQRRLAILETEMASVKDMQHDIHDDVKAIRKQMDRLGGMGFAVLMFGGFITGVVALWDKVRSWI